MTSVNSGALGPFTPADHKALSIFVIFAKNVLFTSYGIIYLPYYAPLILSPCGNGSPTRGTNGFSITTTCVTD